VAQYNKRFKRLSNVPGPRDPINEHVIAQLPAYARIERYRQAREALMLTRMAKALLPAEDARDYALSLIDTIPVVALAAQDAHLSNSFKGRKKAMVGWRRWLDILREIIK
jgi:hypothetical protein